MKNPYQKVKTTRDRSCSECGLSIDFSLRGTSTLTCSEECLKKRTKRLQLEKKYGVLNITTEPLLDSHYGLYRGERERGFNLKPNHCIYCGDWYQRRDHIVPVLVDSVDRNYNPNKTCHCCSLCNQLAGSYFAQSIEDKALYILGNYRKRFRNIISLKDWDNDELDELNGSLHEYVRSKQNMKRLIDCKIDNLLLVSSGSEAIRLNDNVFYSRRLAIDFINEDIS